MTLADLRSRIESYLELRQSLGFRTRYERDVLRAFAGHLEGLGHQGPLHARIAVEWAASGAPRNAGPPGQRIRLVCLSCFMRHLKAFFPETEIPGHGVLARVPRPKPYTYSHEEIARLLEATLLLWEPGSMRQHTMHTFIGLLASTGLRASEALGLTVGDLGLDLDPPRILIRNTKFYKSRLVPIHPTTAEKLRVYLRERKRLCPVAASNAVFLRDQGGLLRYHHVQRDFLAITRLLGIQKQPNRKGPALHSLRHTFAVERLASWHRAGKDARTLLPHLSVYLGHISPEETYWYLTATPELLAAASTNFERHVYGGGSHE